ncbi:uncharacterized protein [Lepeophtheirus salmonis]|uniref:uncharacterized protein n=1 Tax=Lepeophtheirus salmonis TaxID=72036 RepID=UPI003AF364E0
MCQLDAVEAVDVSSIEQLYICVWTTSDKLVLEENFQGLYSVDQCNSASIFNTIKDPLTRYNLPLSLCRAAASFQDNHTGVATRLQEEEPRIITTYGYMYSVNLAAQDMVNHAPKLRNFLTTVTDLVNFLRNSPKSFEIVKNVT